MPSSPKTNSSRRQAGQLGGQATCEKYGLDYYRAIGSLGGRTTMARHAREYDVYRRRGGQAGRPQRAHVSPQERAGDQTRYRGDHRAVQSDRAHDQCHIEWSQRVSEFSACDEYG